MKAKDIRNILFLDIETVSIAPNFTSLTPALQKLWKNKAKSLSKASDEITEEHCAHLYEEKAGIFSEFSKIVCISVAYISVKKRQLEEIKYKSFSGHDEKVLLTQFASLFNKYYNNPKSHFLAGHNIKEFDIPFICRRMIIQQVPLPRLLDIRGKKPWQLPYLLDTLELWKFGDYKNYTSLDLLCEILSIPSPKTQLDGSLVGKTYWQDDDMDKIVHYCQSDVRACILVYLRMYNLILQNVEMESPMALE